MRHLLVADHWVVLGERHVEEYASRLQLTDRPISMLHNAVRIPDTPVGQSGVERVHVTALGRLGVRKGSYDLIAADCA